MQAVERLLLGLVVAVAVVGLLVVVALFSLAGESSDAAKASDRQAKALEKRACIDAAVARYPAVSVSAFVTRDRSEAGPLKLSFVKERQKAVAACE
jgi:type II secretory pathway pseudopilin PulG